MKAVGKSDFQSLEWQMECLFVGGGSLHSAWSHVSFNDSIPGMLVL